MMDLFEVGEKNLHQNNSNHNIKYIPDPTHIIMFELKSLQKLIKRQ